jgi:hypothetical protein
MSSTSSCLRRDGGLTRIDPEGQSDTTSGIRAITCCATSPPPTAPPSAPAASASPEGGVNVTTGVLDLNGDEADQECA